MTELETAERIAPGPWVLAVEVIEAAREAVTVMQGISDRDLYRAEKKLRDAIKKWDEQA